jgi:hypothetical protein
LLHLLSLSLSLAFKLKLKLKLKLKFKDSKTQKKRQGGFLTFTAMACFSVDYVLAGTNAHHSLHHFDSLRPARDGWARYGAGGAAAVGPIVQAYFNMSYLTAQTAGRWIGEGDVASQLRELADTLSAHVDPSCKQQVYFV